MYLSYSDITIDGSRISGNSAEGEAGGVALYRQHDGVTTTIRASTIEGNEATGGDGGGISFPGSFGPDPGPVLIENTTISDNSATGRGGGIYSYNNADNARTIRNSTVVDNVAYAGSSGSAGGGGIYEFASTTLGPVLRPTT